MVLGKIHQDLLTRSRRTKETALEHCPALLAGQRDVPQMLTNAVEVNGELVRVGLRAGPDLGAPIERIMEANQMPRGGDGCEHEPEYQNCAHHAARFGPDPKADPHHDDE